MRRAGAEKQGTLEGLPLQSKEVSRSLALGVVKHLAGVVGAMRLHRVNPEFAKTSGATQFLGEWLCGAQPEDLHALANFLQDPGLMNDADPIACRLRSYGIQIGQIGETVRDSLARATEAELMAAIHSHGLTADWTTVRRTLNRLGVRRRRGRPKKLRDS